MKVNDEKTKYITSCKYSKVSLRFLLCKSSRFRTSEEKRYFSVFLMWISHECIIECVCGKLTIFEP